MPTPPNQVFEEFLYAYTDAIFDNTTDTDTLVQEYSIPPEEAERYTALLEQLDTTLEEISPERDFKRKLRADLIGSPAPSLVGRVLNLPPRLQFAAALALVAAMALLGRRRLRQEALRLLQAVRTNPHASETNTQEAKFTAS